MPEIIKKPLLTFRKHIKKFDDYINPDVKDITNIKNIACLRRLNAEMGMPTDRFYYKRFDSIIMFNQFKEWLNNIDISPETKKSYAFALKGALGKYPDGFTISNYNLYSDLAKTCYQNAVELRPVKPDVTFENLPEKCSAIIANCKNVSAVRVIAIFIKYNVFNRPSDYHHTRLRDNGLNSYLDIGTGRWLIRSGCTKNKTEHLIELPAELIIDLKKILPMGGDCLLYNKSIKPYTDITSLSKIITRQFGYRFNDLRTGGVQLIHRNKGLTIADAEAEAFKMGHSLRTANESYNS